MMQAVGRRLRARSTASDTTLNNNNETSQPVKKARKQTATRQQLNTAQAQDMEDLMSSSSEWSPRFWREHLDNIRIMRADNAPAPVDTIGCTSLHDVNADAKTQRYQILISLMLSSQTKDQVTAAVMQRLRAEGCTPEHIHSIDQDTLAAFIKPASFHNTKAKNIKLSTAKLIADYEGDVPNTVALLCALPGVGPKMAHLVMLCAWKECTGIAVDTHVHRIANRLGWVPRETKSPDATQKHLESFLPRENWPEVNKLLVGFGQTVCAAVKPLCADCLNCQTCPYAIKNPQSTRK